MHATSSSVSLIETFRKRFEELAGVVHVVSNGEAAAKAIESVVREELAVCVALAHLDDGLRDAIRPAMPNDVRVLEPPYPSSELPELLDEAQVGITGVDWAIAETATLVEICTDDSTRLVSGLPRTHIGVVRASTLIPKFFDAAQPIREALAANPKDCAISFISGPSRTGDIEMILTLGVHGPERAHAVIIEDL